MARPTIRCSVETYSSSISVASCWAAVIAASDSRDSCGVDAGAGGAGQPVEQVLRLGPDGRGFDADGLQQWGGNAVVLGEQCHQQVGGTDLRVAGGGGRLQRRGQRRLGLGRRVERVHDTSVQSERSEKMLVAMFNVVKVESVPLNFSRPCDLIRNSPGRAYENLHPEPVNFASTRDDPLTLRGASPRAEPRSPTRSLTVRPATSPALNRVRSPTSGLSWPRPGRVRTAAFRESTKCGKA